MTEDKFHQHAVGHGLPVSQWFVPLYGETLEGMSGGVAKVEYLPQPFLCGILPDNVFLNLHTSFHSTLKARAVGYHSVNIEQ